MRILSLDPGTRNFAYALRDSGELLEVGWLPSLEGVEGDARYINACIELLTRTKPHYVVAERFMVRNRGQSVHAEAINQMIGRLAILSRVYAAADLIQITAAQWKNWFGKQGQDSTSLFPEVESIHQRDAAAIGLYLDTYWLERMTGR